MLEGSRRSSSEDKVIFGVDILPGKSSLSTSQPHYALVILRGEKVVARYDDVSLSRLLRLIWEYKPSIIAVDNVYELAPSKSKLMKIITLLPPETEIVQVTGWGSQATSLKNLARELGIDASGKLTPLKTAYIAALAAYRGYGYKVKFLEEKTKIIVSRGRSISRGGMSQNRFIRSIRAGILSVTREIKRILDQNKLDYDLVFRKAKGGLERSIFIVYAPRSKLYGLIKPINTKNVKVEIKPVYKHKILVPRSNTPEASRYLIVGIDPGVSTGIAILDLNGVPLFIYSSKNIDRSDIVNMILSIGTPIIIATDTNPPPDTIKKIASMLKAQVYVPPRSLSTEEKNEIANMVKERFPWIDIEDSHERDALAAAYKAYQSLEKKFMQIEASVEKIGLEIDVERVKADIIRGKTIAEAIEAEINRILEEAEQGEKGKEVKVKRERVCAEEDKRIEKLKDRIKALEAERLRLLSEIKDLRNKIRELELELNILKHDRVPQEETLVREIDRLKTENAILSSHVKELKERLNELSSRYERLKNILIEISMKGFIAIPKVSSIDKGLVSRINNYKVKAVYVDDTSRLTLDQYRALEDSRIALIVRGPVPSHAELRIPIININRYKHYTIDDHVFVEPKIIEDIEESWKRIEEERKREEFDRIIKLIEEYQRERKKKFGVSEFRRI